MMDKNMRLMMLLQKAHGFAWRHQMQSFASEGMNPHMGQGRVLAILNMQDEMEQKELGYILDVSKQALAELIGKLEKKGYITRKESQKDRRSFTVSITEEGRKALQEDNDKENDIESIFDCLNEEEFDNLLNYLERIVDSLVERLKSSDDYAEFFRERFFSRFGEGGMGFGRRGDGHFDR